MNQGFLALTTLLGFPIGLITVFFVVRNGIRDARNDREKRAQAAIDRAVADATAPLKSTIEALRDGLAAMTKSNDRNINRVDALERELRQRGGN